MQRNQIAVIAVLIVLVGLGYYFTYNKPTSSDVPANSNATTSPATTTESNIADGTVGITASGGGYTIKTVPSKNNPPKAPDYNAPLVFSASSGLTAEQQATLQARASELRAQLAKNTFDYDAWLALGAVFKTAGDYAGAAKIWAYISLNWPTDAVALGNLGDLYMNFVKDYPKADANYRAAIQRDPRSTNAYRSLFQLYSGMYTTHASAAEDILKKGIQNNPEMLDFYVLLARYYRDQGRIAEAKAAYNAAIVIAKGQTGAGAAGILADITAEQAALK